MIELSKRGKSIAAEIGSIKILPSAASRERFSEVGEGTSRRIRSRAGSSSSMEQSFQQKLVLRSSNPSRLFPPALQEQWALEAACPARFSQTIRMPISAGETPE